jgi:hypothetical protein
MKKDAHLVYKLPLQPWVQEEDKNADKSEDIEFDVVQISYYQYDGIHKE